MGKSSQYTHYMQRVDQADNLGEIDIEEQFSGLLYMSAEGMNDIGKPKNIYTESYAESDALSVYLPQDSGYANEATKITMHFLVVGDASTRQTTIKNFFDYIRVGVHKYWDNARNLNLYFIVTDELKVSDERWHGSTPYVELVVTLQNINGRTSPHV